MAATAAVPTLSQIQAWDTTHLDTAATHWSDTADMWENTFTRIHYEVANPGVVAWQGRTAEAALLRTAQDRYRAIEAADSVRAAAKAARLGAGQIQGARQVALDAVADAEMAGFTVGEDLSVTSSSAGGPPAAQAARQAQAEEHAATIRLRAADLLAADRDVASRITTAGEVTSIDDAWNELNRCLRCNFPMGGAPSKLPKVGDELPVESELPGNSSPSTSPSR